jgi:glycosyltransferase involved in cell wall biosynthesis
VDADRYKPHNGRVAEVEARYHLPEGRRVLFVGRLAKDKKIEVLIQAMQGIAEERDLHLLLVGRGDHRPHLEKLVRELSLQQHVHFLGFVPEEDLPDVYRASQLFAIASICEVQSIPALQAAATGLPLVGVNAAALPELVQSGRNGFLVDPNNPQAIRESFCKISADPNLAQDFGKASLEISLAHAETETFRLYGRFYREIVANTGRLAS